MKARMRPVRIKHLCCHGNRIVVFNERGEGYTREANWTMDTPWAPMPPPLEPVPEAKRRTLRRKR